MKTTIWIVIVCLLVGIIIGLTVSGKFPVSGMVIKSAEGIKPVKVYQINDLSTRGINKVIIEEENLVCYIKTNQGQGMSCFKETTTATK